MSEITETTFGPTRGLLLVVVAMEKTEEMQAPEKNAGVMEVTSSPSSPLDSEHRVGHQADDDIHISLSWRSWVVVFMSCFAYVSIPSTPSLSDKNIANRYQVSWLRSSSSSPQAMSSHSSSEISVSQLSSDGSYK